MEPIGVEINFNREMTLLVLEVVQSVMVGVGQWASPRDLTHNFHYSEAEQIWGCVKVGSQFGVWGQMGIGMGYILGAF